MACAFVATTGLLLEKTLPPGSGRLEIGLPDRQITMLWGLTRHEWGQIHLWTAYALLAILVLHLALHWRWLLAAFTRKSREGHSATRFLLGCFGLIGLLVSASPLFGTPGTVTRSEALEARGIQSAAPIPERTVTIQELERISGVPAATLRERLGADEVVLAETELSGKQLYEQHCGGCHGAGGTGPLPADPEQAASQLGQTRPEAPHQAALRALSAAELRTLLLHLRQLKQAAP